MSAVAQNPELDAENYHFYPSCFLGKIHVRSVISHKKGKFVFDGYFYLHPGVFSFDRPVKMLMGYRRHFFFISIHKKIDVEDTSVYWSDDGDDGDDGDEEMRICLFPTKRTELHYTVLEINPTKERIGEIMKEIEVGFQSLREESYELEKKDRERELKEWISSQEKKERE